MIKDTLFAGYVAERGQHLIENEASFIVYSIFKDECFIVEMGVDFRKRRTGVGKSILTELEQISKERECKWLSAKIHLTNPNANNTLVAAISSGFKVVRAEGGILLIAKDISKE